MRNAFAKELTELATADARIVLLSGDIGNRLFDDFKAKCPGRFLNCGVAEANMVSMAAGMAMSGLRPVAYTITPFITTRCLEQIRVDVCYHNVPVVLVGVGAGLSYATLGPTHHSCEDIAFLRVIPGMTVLCPGDPVEVRLALRAALAQEGPVYIRMGKKGEPVVHRQPPDFRIGKAIPLREGTDVCILATGTILPEALRAAESLAAEGVSAAVASFHTVKPLDAEYLKTVFGGFPLVATVEEHSAMGGLGGAVAEWLTEQPTGRRARLLRIGTRDEFLHASGELEFAREHFGLSAHALTGRIQAALHGDRAR